MTQISRRSFFLATLAVFTGGTEAYSSFARPRAMTMSMSTTVAPPQEKTRRRTRTIPTEPKEGRPGRPFLAPGSPGGPLEYLQDDQSISRDVNDPFHILLLGKTFENPRISVPYVAGSLTYVLLMPDDEATEHATFAEEQGVSVLGTWPRKECLELGQKLQVRDLVCRVVPGSPAGSQGWQAKGADTWDVPSLS